MTPASDNPDAESRRRARSLAIGGLAGTVVLAIILLVVGASWFSLLPLLVGVLLLVGVWTGVLGGREPSS